MDSENEEEKIEIEVRNSARWKWPIPVTNQLLTEVYPKNVCPTYPDQQDCYPVALRRSGLRFFVNEQDVTCMGTKSEKAVRRILISFARDALEKVRVHLQPKRVETKKKKKKKKKKKEAQ
jgi:hypothetical protein